MSSVTHAEPSHALPDEIVPFQARDGHACNLIHVRGATAPHKGPVLLVHGAGVRANAYRPPVRETIVDFLVNDGWDVWLENWRASIDLARCPWTLDEAAYNDHPVAVELVAQMTKSQKVAAVVHCQGSTSFMMALAAGLLPQVDVVVSNAVSLHPVVPFWSHIKLDYLLPLLNFVTHDLDPQWAIDKEGGFAAIVRDFVNATHHECRNPVCKLVSFTYGAGFPALWSHEMIDEPTHRWIENEFGCCPLSFFNQMARCVDRGELVTAGEDSPIERDFLRTFCSQARVALFAGARSRCFLPASQERSFAYLQERSPRNGHTLHVLPEYGHQDVFIGRYASTDVFPLIVRELGNR